MQNDAATLEDGFGVSCELDIHLPYDTTIILISAPKSENLSSHKNSCISVYGGFIRHHKKQNTQHK